MTPELWTALDSMSDFTFFAAGVCVCATRRESYAVRYIMVESLLQATDPQEYVRECFAKPQGGGRRDT